jgi:branched-chain amino acid transport system permease protein
MQKRILLALAFLFLVVSFFVNEYHLHVMTIMLVNIMLAVSLNWVMGYLGQLTLANAAIFGFGAYTSAILISRWDVFYPVAILSSIAVGSIINAMISLPVLRLKGFFLAIATMTFGVFAHWFFVHGGSITAGASGLSFPRPNFEVLGVDNSTGLFVIAFLATIVTIMLTSRLVASSFGRNALCIAEQELIAPIFGIDVARHKLKVFLVSGAIAGGAGAVFAGLLGLVDPEAFNLVQMITQFMMVVLGGLGSILGSIVGASLVTGLIEALRAFKGFHEIAMGAILLVVILFAPRGLYRLIVSGRPEWAEARFGGDALKKMAVDPSAQASFFARAADKSVPPQSNAIPVDKHAIVVENVQKIFGGLAAVDGVSFAVREGSIHGLIGPNGSGKSTMLNLISRSLPLSSGSVQILGSDISALPTHLVSAMGVARTFQNLQLVSELTVLENVMLGAVAGQNAKRSGGEGKRLKALESEAVATSMQALAFVGMEGFAFRRGNELSGGQMRLVEIARALAAQPKVLLLDEPAAGLSLNRIDTIKSLILRINRELGVTVLLVEHVLNLVLEVSEKVTVLNAGKLLAEGSPKEIRENPAVREAYLGKRH